jgi:hypothetical protein
VFSAELTEHLRHQPAGSRTDHAEARLARDVSVATCNVGRNVIDFVENAPRTFDYARPLIGEFALLPINQRDSQFFFESSNVCGDV